MVKRCSRLLFTPVGLLLISQLGCGSATGVGARPGTPAGRLKPEITFASTLYDFGEVSPGKKCVGEFEFANTGASLLRITEVKKCCGVVTELEKEELMPGQTGGLKVEYRSGRSAGTMRRHLYVSSNDAANPKVTLTIKAKIVPKVTYEPQRLTLSLKGENAGCPPITLTSIDNQPFAVKTVTSTSNCVTADVDPPMKATKFVLHPRVDLERLQGRSAGIIRIGLTHPECTGVSIYFNVLPKFKVTPPSLIVLDAEPQKPIVRKVTVQSNYGEDFEVESVLSKSDFLKVLGQERIGNTYQVEVEITPPLPAEGEDAAKFAGLLYVNLEGGERLTVTTYGTCSSEGGDPFPSESKEMGKGPDAVGNQT